MRISLPTDDADNRVLPNRDHVYRFLGAEPKVCPDCKLKNHGWNKRCSCGKLWDNYIDVQILKRLRNYGQ